MRRTALAAVLALLLAAPAAAFLGPEQKQGDLDGDGAAETVKAVRVPVPGVTEPRFDNTAVEIDAACEEGSGDIASFAAGYRKRRGSTALDVVLKEDFQRPGEPSTFGSIHKTTLWRYSRKRDRYVRIRTSVRYGRPLTP